MGVADDDSTFVFLLTGGFKDDIAMEEDKPDGLGDLCLFVGVGIEASNSLHLFASIGMKLTDK